jgi:exodeoxyribonuclease VII large subunit
MAPQNLALTKPCGVGALQLALKRLHQKLAAEGLFAPERKRPLPRFPRRVAFVTSPTGAAVRDFLEVARRRWGRGEVLIIPVRVQGPGAAEEIAAGIRLAHRLPERPDVLVIGRGGGSPEDLWCFNEEVVVRAVCASRIPVVSAVGHEIDVALSDLAADVRALTPSEAAERVFPSTDEVRGAVASLGRRLAASCGIGSTTPAPGSIRFPSGGCSDGLSSRSTTAPAGSMIWRFA